MTCLGSFSHVISVLHLFLLSRCFQRTSADPLWHNFGLNSHERCIFEMNSRCYGDHVSCRSTRQVPLENRICNPPPLNWNRLLGSAFACLMWRFLITDRKYWMPNAEHSSTWVQLPMTAFHTKRLERHFRNTTGGLIIGLLWVWFCYQHAWVAEKGW